MCICHGSARDVGATPSETTSVSGHCSQSPVVTLSPRTARKNTDDPRFDRSGRRRSTHLGGSGEADDYFPTVFQLAQTLDEYPPTTPIQLAKEPGKHYGERCASPERQFKCEGWCDKGESRKVTLSHPDVVCWVVDHYSIPSRLFPWFL